MTHHGQLTPTLEDDDTDSTDTDSTDNEGGGPDGGGAARRDPATAAVPVQRSPGRGPSTATTTVTATATATATLRLATADGISACLATLGLIWEPQSISPQDLGRPDADRTPGLYAWVYGPPGNELTNPVLYIGKGEGRRGMAGRLKNEWSWIGPNFWHGHGMAMHRLGGRSVGGPVSFRPDSATWLEGCEHPRLEAARHWLEAKGPADPLGAAERIAIRITMHLGDVVAPVNSHQATAWLNRSPSETLAYLSTERFEARQSLALE